MSAPNSATRTLQIFASNNAHRSDAVEGAIIALLEALDATGAVADGSRPVRAVLDWMQLNLTDSFFVREAYKRLNTAAVREAQRGY